MKIAYILLIALFVILSGCNYDYNNDDDNAFEDQDYAVITITDNLRHPWGMEFIDETTIIVTQKHGAISIIDIDTGLIIDLDGVPEVNAIGQGGMLDIALKDEWLYMTYSASYDEGITTHLARGILNLDTYSIGNIEVLYRAHPTMSGGAHFGSRVIIDNDYVYFSIGDRGDKNFGLEHVSQDTTNTLGTIIRLYSNGTIPDNNPFIDNDSVVDSIYTYGHRNVQGMTINPITGEIWISEHGEQDGDSVSILEAGGNYGWPIAHYGCTYGLGRPIGEYPHDNPDVINPIYYWECRSGGFPPAGMTFYDGDAFVEWQGNLFIGNLAHQYLGRFEVNNRQVLELDPLLEGRGWRIRDVKQSPDGYLYVITDASPGGLYRIELR